MKRVLVVALALAASAAAAAAAAGGAAVLLLPRATAAGEQTYFGHVRSLAPRGGHYLMRFDPAWFTSGVTANTAAAEDGVVPRGEPVPNDNYVVDESHRAYTFVLPRDARVTVLTNNGRGVQSTRIGVDELARIVRGQQPHHRLFEPLASGVWIRVRIDTVRSLDQQYRP